MKVANLCLSVCSRSTLGDFSVLRVFKPTERIRQYSVIIDCVQVEEVKEEDGHSSSNASDFEDALSDRDDAGHPRPAEKPFVQPSQEVKEKILKQVRAVQRLV